MIEQVTRHPRVRDRALYIGDPDHTVPDRFGPGFPLIRDWTSEHFKTTGYIDAFDAGDYADVSAVRDGPDTNQIVRWSSAPWAAPRSASTCCARRSQPGR